MRRKTSPRWKPRPSSPGSATAQKLFSPATLIKSIIPTWTLLPTASITSSAASARSRSPPTSSFKRVSARNWPSWRPIFSEQGSAFSALGIPRHCPYVHPLTGFLRFVGILNAAVWLGGGIFFTLGSAPAVFSRDMQSLLGREYYPYFSGAIAQVLIAKSFHLQIICV